MFFSSVKSSMQTFLLHDSHNTGFSNAFFFPEWLKPFLHSKCRKKRFQITPRLNFVISYFENIFKNLDWSVNN